MSLALEESDKNIKNHAMRQKAKSRKIEIKIRYKICGPERNIEKIFFKKKSCLIMLLVEQSASLRFKITHI